ncbi:MAG: UDP-glucose dehydrogenase family protein [Anaerolineae bacterium]
MQILIVGTGYVGLVTGACFAEMGHHVVCFDIDSAKIKALKAGIIPIFEPGLEELIHRNVASGRLKFTDDYADALPFAEVSFIAVPTPSSEDGSCDISFVLEAAREIAKNLVHDHLIVIKSTVPVGSSIKAREAITKVLEERAVNISFDLVANPEFLKEGSAINDCMKPDRVIIGAESKRAVSLMKELYAAFTINHDRMIFMDIASAEMTKYAANAMLATRISFMNEIAAVCEKVGANINQIRIGIGSDMRIGYHFLYAGVGYGGSCFPKDLAALKALAKDVGCDVPLLEAVGTINERQKKALAKKIDAYFASQGGLKDKTIAIWGLSFKPNTDDVREAPSLHLIEELLKMGASLRLFDPVSMKHVKHIFKDHPNLLFCKDEYEAALGAHAVALVTEWKQFHFVDFKEVLGQMQGRAFFDGRNQYQHQEMIEKGFDYFGIGISNTC